MPSNQQQETVTVGLDEASQQLISAGQEALTVARSYQITTPDIAEAVAEHRNQLLGEIKALKAKADEVIGPLKKSVQTIAGWFKPGIDGRQAAVDHYAVLLQDWTAKERARVDAENRAIEEAQRKARQEAAAKIAQERARAAQEAAEKERAARQQREIQERATAEAEAKRRAAAEAEGAERKRLEAEARAATEQATRAAAASAKAAEQATAITANAESMATEIQLTAAATAPVYVAPASIAGLTMKTKWGAYLKPDTTELQARMLICKAIVAGRTELLALWSMDETALRKQAESLHESFNVPGYVAINNPIPTKARGS